MGGPGRRELGENVRLKNSVNREQYPDEAELGKKDDIDATVVVVNILSSSSSIIESALSKERNDRPR